MAENEKNNKSESALREERILEFWRENKIFEQSLEKESPKGEFVFYEGPPTANGKPGIHHLEARAFKDIIPRYKTMRGYHVRRKAGWDTHGLPVELEVEKQLGLKSKKEIEKYGVADFNKKCKESVWKYLDLWNTFTERIGYWVDQKDPYITYDPKYMESLWNVVKNVNDKGLLYKDYKVVPWCPRCGTALSSHELAQGYEIVKDLSVYVKFKLASPDTYILAWTTTPWTLPGNVALAVGEKIDYVKIKSGNDFFILAKARLSVIDGEYEVVEEMKGKDLLGLEYEPLYPFLKDNLPEGEKAKLEKAYKVYGANFVTTEDGTGVVHTAVMYGADDFDLGNKIGLPKFHLVGDDGNFLDFAGFLSGKFVKDEATTVEIIKDLAHRGLLQKKEKYEHSYPHCWRCKTPLIYFARDSWYIGMSKLREELVSENKKINWEPEHTKEGRFGEWLREVKDWAISRERYWGTPLPVWICEECGEGHVAGGVSDLKEKVKKSGNKYFVMRHGEIDSNKLGLVCTDIKASNHLNENGRKQVVLSAQKLKEKNIDLIFASDFIRAEETASIVREELGLYEDQIITDIRLREMQIPSFEGKTWSEYHKKHIKDPAHFDFKEPGDESYLDVKKRMMSLVYDIEKRYQNKNILIVTHGGPGWLLFTGTEGKNVIDTFKIIEKVSNFHFMQNAEIRELPFAPLPHNEDYELDLHKPFIDEVKLVCDCGWNMKRVKEVMDVWFDSGCMPFAQDHYPFEADKKLLYPADYISEAIDQTRGWFYTLLAVGVLMGKGTPYKNVICLGHILDAEGKKMSKSVGNVVDPWTMIEKYGADTLRLWMYSVNQPGESKNFDEKTVLELHRQIFGLLYNVLAFYELYRDPATEQGLYDKKPANILDQWIIARLDELTLIATEKLDAYKVLEPVRAIKDFIGDLSTWYLRRSRERIKEGDIEAKRTLYFVLKNLAKLLAPFAPFSAEDIWLRLRVEQNKESVHLTNWPDQEKVNVEVLENMQKVRDIVSLGLEARQKAGIKVRQPLANIEIKNSDLPVEYMELIKDELNVKEVIQNPKIESEVSLDIEITPGLKQEGDYRELVRAIQDMRKKMGLTPSDTISLSVDTDEAGKKLIEKFEADMKKTVLSSKINLAENNGQEIQVDDLLFKIKIEK